MHSGACSFTRRESAFSIEAMFNQEARSTLSGRGLLLSMLIISAASAQLFADKTTEVTNPELRTPTGPELPKSKDLRPQFKTWNLLPKSQRKRNTCSVFTTTAALEFAASKHYGKGTRLSVEYLNWACNQVIHNETVDRGQFFRDLLKGFEKYGICLEADMPYKDRFDPQLKPSEAAIESAKQIESLGLIVHWVKQWNSKPGVTDKHLLEIKKVLAKGYPMAAGANHSRLLVGYRDDAHQAGGGTFLTKDSGAGAFKTVTYEFVKDNVRDLFWVETPAVTESSHN